MVTTVERGQLPSRDAQDRAYNEVRTIIDRQFQELTRDGIRVTPRKMSLGARYLFRTVPGPLLRPLVTFEVPDEAWLSPSDQYGRVKLTRHLRRVTKDVPGLTIDWGKLNRIAAERAGMRTIEFTSIPQTKEAYYATNDPYIAAVIREHIRRAADPQSPKFGNEFRFFYEVDKGRYIQVGNHRFEDTEQGRAEAFAFSDQTGIRDFKLIVDDGFEELELLEVNADQEAEFHRQELDMEQAAALLMDNQGSVGDFEPKPAASVTRMDVVQEEDQRELTPQEPKKGRKKKAADAIPDPLEGFQQQMEEKLTPDAGAAIEQTAAENVGDSDLVADAEEGSIDDLLSDFIEVNSDDEARVSTENLEGTG